MGLNNLRDSRKRQDAVQGIPLDEVEATVLKIVEVCFYLV